ncbi:unnamed protein product [Taenia asiatica]|uniref:Uncharacterized protein n=1 Tax=Taenia asiatica TaxID=60517 RepID=A0A0R3WDF8_TAEAS|nr:unnamed protein product [Taenia asiatica]
MTLGVPHLLPCREGRFGLLGKEKARKDERAMMDIDISNKASELDEAELAFLRSLELVSCSTVGHELDGNQDSYRQAHQSSCLGGAQCFVREVLARFLKLGSCKSSIEAVGLKQWFRAELTTLFAILHINLRRPMALGVYTSRSLTTAVRTLMLRKGTAKQRQIAFEGVRLQTHGAIRI